MKTLNYKTIKTEKVGRKFKAITSFGEEGSKLMIEYTQWGNTEQEAIDKVMKFLLSSGEYKLNEESL